MILKSYQDFIDRVEEVGFLPFSSIVAGMTSLTAETEEVDWHTGDHDTDPWKWKDRAAEEKRLAFGCVLGGQKGFLSPIFYPIFYRACHPEESMEIRYHEGLVEMEVWKLWQIFQEKTLLNTSDIRREMGVTQKQGGSRIDRATIELQKYFYITVAGNRQKTDKFGKPYGWPANVYDRCLDWAPKEWMTDVMDISKEEAREQILEASERLGKNVDLVKLRRILFK